MITAEKLNLLSTLNTKALTQALDASGYKGCKFKTSYFLGLTNGKQFCYSVCFVDNDKEHLGKVFVSYDNAKDTITAEF